MSKLNKVMNVETSRRDSWVNALTGLGNSLRDKIASTLFQRGVKLSDDTLETLYHEEDMAARICDALPEDALRKGFGVKVEPEIAEKTKEHDQKLGFASSLLEAAVWSRCFGGAGLFLGIDDGQKQDQPVNEDTIKAIRFVTVFDKRTFMPEAWYDNPFDPKYGEPKTYRVISDGVNQNAGALVHESRLLVLKGARTSLRRKIQNGGWNESVLQKVNDVLIQFNIGWQGTAHLLQDAAQGVFKIEGLIDMIASGDKDSLQSRMELVDMSRSVARSIMLDADRESFERAGYSFGGIPEILQAFMLRLSAAARMPVSVLMGQAPAGLNATGESDTRLWYDQVQSYQTQSLLPVIQRFYSLLFKSTEFNVTEPWSIYFEKLWQLTDVEQANLEKTVAEKDRTYIDAGVLLPEEVALNRYGSGGFSQATQINLEARQEILDTDAKI